MPIVQIDLMQGRPVEKLERMIRSVSDAVAASLDAPVDSVRVIVREMQPHHYGVGGKTWPEVLAEHEAGSDT